MESDLQPASNKFNANRAIEITPLIIARIDTVMVQADHFEILAIEYGRSGTSSHRIAYVAEVCVLAPPVSRISCYKAVDPRDLFNLPVRMLDNYRKFFSRGRAVGEFQLSPAATRAVTQANERNIELFVFRQELSAPRGPIPQHIGRHRI